MNQILKLYVPKEQTPESLSILNNEAVSIDYKNLETLIRIPVLCQIALRYAQTDEEKANLGCFAIGKLAYLNVDEYGTSAEKIKNDILRKIPDLYKNIKFPVNGLNSIEDLFVFGINYGQHTIHEGLFRTMDKSMHDCDMVPLQ